MLPSQSEPPAPASATRRQQRLSTPHSPTVNMATSTPFQATRNDETTPGSSKLKLIPSFPKHVFLYDWWLIKADKPSDGKVLGVGGLSSNEQLGIRILQSAAIVKRHNTNIVETVDGLKITLSGSINKPRTVLNGFPPQVCSEFIFGFPYFWEEFSLESFAKEASDRATDNSGDAANKSLHESFDKLSGALIRDLVVSAIESSGSGKLRSIFGDMLETYGCDSVDESAELASPRKENNQVRRDSAEGETHNGHQKMEVKQTQNDEDDGTGAKPRKRVGRPSKRIRSCLKIASNKQEEEKFMSSSEKSQLTKSMSETPKKQHGELLSGINVSSAGSSTRILSLRNRSIDFCYHVKGKR